MNDTVIYQNDDLVYIDMQARRVFGPVEWDQTGNAIKKQMPPREQKEGDDQKRRTIQVKYYPWCSYKTAKKVYHIEGKFVEEGEYESFETVLEKALKEAYWN